ncbi:hypothetical protein HYX17_00800 [Candidatus Woesearchaeota archaeon]|nr:hypothetical protein [Candidatus Woesearchaeota archaeon]
MSPKLLKVQLYELSKIVKSLKMSDMDDPATLKAFGGVEVCNFNKTRLKRYCGSLNIEKERYSTE